MQSKRLSDKVELKPIGNEYLINSIYHHPDIRDRILHDGVEEYYIKDPTVIYLGAYVDDKLVGVFMLILKMIDCDIHIAILKEYTLYQRILCELCIDTVFEANYSRISLTVTDYARKMVNLALKLGFKYEGCKRKAFLKNGILWDIHMLGMIRQEWRDKWEKL